MIQLVVFILGAAVLMAGGKTLIDRAISVTKTTSIAGLKARLVGAAMVAMGTAIVGFGLAIPYLFR